MIGYKRNCKKCFLFYRPLLNYLSHANSHPRGFQTSTVTDGPLQNVQAMVLFWQSLSSILQLSCHRISTATNFLSPAQETKEPEHAEGADSEQVVTNCHDLIFFN